MKLVMGIMIAALLSSQALAQGKARPSDNGQAAKVEDKQKRYKAEDEAAKAAMSKIPDSKEKYDPWKIAR